ncbi:MAG: hypothetical protein ACOH1J_05630 [Microbacteriaceae bacterium]
MLIILIVVAGCAPIGASSPAEGASDNGVPDGISVRLYQNRTDAAARQVQVQVANNTQLRLRVFALHLDSTRFVESARYDKPNRVPPNSADIPAGATRDLPIRLPTASCAPATQRDVMSFDYEWEDGRKGGVVVDLAEAASPGSTTAAPSTSATPSTSILDQITAIDCLAAAIADIVTIVPPTDAEWMPGAHSPATLTIGFIPTGAEGSVLIATIGSTTLLAPLDVDGAPVPEARFDLLVDASTGPASISLRVQPGRCDPHAIAEDKKGTLLPISVSITDGPSGTYSLPVSGEVRRSLYDYVTNWCESVR